MSFFVFALIYVAAVVVFFAVKLNHGNVVETAQTSSDDRVAEEIEAIDFYWRPG